jgi:Dolichyl-phosphate-mannose-protein mannosyltransferase
VRLWLAMTYDPRTGFDFTWHWGYAQYIVAHGSLPPFDLNAASYHPPLYYALVALLARSGLDAGAFGWMSALCGVLRLGIVWMGLERWLPESRMARVIAILAASTIPAAVQIDSMVTNEALSTLFCALAIVAAPAAIVAARTGRFAPALWLGFWLGLALLVKVSAAALVLAVVVGAGVDLVRGGGRWRHALGGRARVMGAGLLLLCAISGWCFVRNKILHGHFSLSGYDGSLKASQAPFEKIPYLDRRTVGFYLGWDDAIWDDPYYPTGYQPHPRFFPVLVASTFCDYYNFGFAGTASPGVPGVLRNQRTVPARALPFSRASVVAGTAIALVAMVTWLAVARHLWRRRDDPRLVLLLIPLAAVAGQLHFATKYPHDGFGPVKGTYIQFVAPILCGLFGLGVAWMWRRARTRAGAVVALGALGMVMVYVGACRWQSAPVTGRAPFFHSPGALPAAPIPIKHDPLR